MTRPPGPTRARNTIWIAGLTVATGAGVATAHGLYQVATSARVPAPIGWLYPLITDGLALVAYAATARLHAGVRRYAAGIVILAAGLSGLAQAVYLAGGLDRAVAPVGLRFGVGAWPAIAAALTAHLLHLISTGTTRDVAEGRSASSAPYNDPSYNAASNPVVQPRSPEPRTTPRVQPTPVAPPYNPPDAVNGADRPTTGGAPRDRARAAGSDYGDRHGELPTVTELVRLAKVARGTAAKALRELRAERRTLHVVTTNPDQRTNQ